MNIDILFDNSTPFGSEKVQVLDEVVSVQYGGNPQFIVQANEILTKLQEDPDFWLKTDTIMDNSKNKNTKFIALMHLEETIRVHFIFTF